MLINLSNGQIQLIEIGTRDCVRRFEGQLQGEYVIRSCFGGADENLVISGSEGIRPCKNPPAGWGYHAKKRLQILGSISGTKQLAASSKPSTGIKLPAVSMSLHGILLIRACSLRAAMTGRLECKFQSILFPAARQRL